MKSLVYCFSILLSLPCSTFSQSLVPDTLWHSSIGNIGNEFPIIIRRASNNTVAILGYQELFYPYRKTTWLTRFSVSGDLISIVPIDSSGINLKWMAVLDSNDMIVCGTKSDSLWETKIDTTRIPHWSQTYLDSASIRDVSLCDSGNLIVTGSLHDSLFLAKISEDGVIKWLKSYSRKGHYSVDGTSVLQLSTGHFVAAANITDTAGDFGSTAAGMYFITSSGDLDTMIVYYHNSRSPIENPVRIVRTPNGSIVMLCNVLLGAYGYNDASLRLTDSNGKELWYHQYGSWNLDEASDIAIDEIGNLSVCGYTKGFGIPNNRDFWVFKCDSTGNMVWNFALGSDLWEVASSITTMDAPCTNGSVACSIEGSNAHELRSAIRKPGAAPNSCPSVMTLLARLACSTTTPLGVPVEPEV